MIIIKAILEVKEADIDIQLAATMETWINTQKCNWLFLQMLDVPQHRGVLPQAGSTSAHKISVSFVKLKPD